MVTSCTRGSYYLCPQGQKNLGRGQHQDVGRWRELGTGECVSALNWLTLESYLYVLLLIVVHIDNIYASNLP